LSGNSATIAGGTSAVTIYFSDDLDIAPLGLTFAAQAAGLSSALIEVTLTAPSVTLISSHSMGSSACALTSGGSVFCWGANTNGMLGNGNSTNSTLPSPVLGGARGAGNLSDMSSVAVGSDFACALTTAGGVYCWGSNTSGSLGNGNSGTNSLTAVQVLGGAQGAGNLSAVTAIAGGADFACGLSTGNVFCWGLNGSGELGNGVTTASGVPVEVVAGAEGAGALANVSSIALGNHHACAIASGGAVYCWGDNTYGQLGVDPTGTPTSSSPVQVIGVGGVGTLSGISALSSGGGHTCGITAAAHVVCWGDDTNGDLGNNSTLSSYAPVEVQAVGGGGALAGVTSIAAGEFHTCAVAAADGLGNTDVVDCWGDGLDGDLGNNAAVESDVPVEVAGLGGSGFLSGVSSVAAGAAYSCALSSAGAVDCWGSNAQGALGTSAPGAQSKVPVHVTW
jgi:alpha-tubulin suppressor-like RCC1 family protein